MIKLVYCVRKRRELSLAEFNRYWLERHGALIRDHARALGATRYVQSHRCAPEEDVAIMKSRGLSEPFDGVGELWWPDLDSYRQHVRSPAAREVRRTLLEDEARFIDFAQSKLFLTEEQTVFEL